MEDIKHLSFDVWGTLIRPNRNVAKLREEFLVSHSGLSPDVVTKHYRAVKHEVDKLAEETGRTRTTNASYEKLVGLLGINPVFVEISKVRKAFEKIFFENPPIVHPEVIGRLRLLVGQKRVTASIASNSNFISGQAMSLFLNRTFGSDVFLFGVYSDEFTCAKPDERLFNHVFTQVHHHDDRVARRSQIMHVGDNKICDEKGAADFGFVARYVENPEAVIPILKEFE